MNEKIEDNFKRIESICEQEISLFYKPIIKGNLNEIKRYIENRQIEIEVYKKESDKIAKSLNMQEGILNPEATDIIEGLKITVTKLTKDTEKKDKIINLMEDEINKILKDSFERIGLDVYLEKENLTVREFIERKLNSSEQN